MKVTKYQKTYRLTVTPQEAILLLGALYNSAQEDMNSGDEDTVAEGYAKEELWHELVAVAGTNG